MSRMQHDDDDLDSLTAATIAAALVALLNMGIDDGEGGLDAAIDLVHGERENDEMPLLESVVNYTDAGLLTRDSGLVLKLHDGTEFQITVKQSRRARHTGCM